MIVLACSVTPRTNVCLSLCLPSSWVQRLVSPNTPLLTEVFVARRPGTRNQRMMPPVDSRAACITTALGIDASKVVSGGCIGQCDDSALSPTADIVGARVQNIKPLKGEPAQFETLHACALSAQTTPVGAWILFKR